MLLQETPTKSDKLSDWTGQRYDIIFSKEVMSENKSAHRGQSAAIVCTGMAPLKKNHKHHTAPGPLWHVTNINGQEKRLFLLLPFRETFPGFSVPEGEMTQYSFGGKHANRCDIEHLFSQALIFPWHTLLHSCKISYKSVGEIPVLHDQRQNSHPLQQGWNFTQSLIPSCLFLSTGGGLHKSFILWADFCMPLT